MSSSADLSSATGGLRERQPTSSAPEPAASPERLREAAREPEADKAKKTFGRTPDGTIPVTHDMVSQLFDPRQPKNISDLLVLALIAAHVLALCLLPASLRRPVFAVIFLFWRASYNVGIGFLLHVQSHHKRLVSWAKKWHLFDDPATGKNPRPWLYALLKKELETKIPEDYSFENAPLEYNTWLVFRRVVDVILMCDFTSYCLFAIACGSRPANETFVMAVLRWTAAVALVGFNLWVKLDAHRVVKDYAWYWGDFFYLIDQELTFDGVFEMAPHPMYSVGYAGYYGISMMAASYSVLIISVVAHAAQFAFLIYVENPHIDKTYNPPAPRKRASTVASSVDGEKTELTAEDIPIDVAEQRAYQGAPGQHLNTHNLAGVGNVDLYRITDVSALLLVGYVFILTMLTPTTPAIQAFFIANAIFWRLWYSVGLGVVLSHQSEHKSWTRHFLKFAESKMEAWRQWKGMYHLSMIMCYASFIAACWKMYSVPADWGYGLVLFNHVFGAGLVALQTWTAASIYDSLGEFGWFYGDFFFDESPKLTYSGIYRYLNNPERILGLAGIWGAVFITGSPAIFVITVLSHLFTLGFIQLVEKPHMQKIYGIGLRKEAGLTKSIKRSLPPPLKQLGGSVDKVFSETTHFLEECVDAARPKFANGVSTFMRDTTALFSQYPARLTITRLAPDLAGFDPKDYSLAVKGTPATFLMDTDVKASSRRRSSQNSTNFKGLVLQYGAPLRVTWTAPVDHSKKDWIGIYRVTDNGSREVTRFSSAGRWIPTVPNEYDEASANRGIVSFNKRVSGAHRKDGSTADWLEGEVEFSGDKLFWTQGVFEFRYHHDGKHNVMAISQPFEIRIDRFDEEEVEVDANGMMRDAVEQALLPVIYNCLDCDPEVAPSTVEERFGSLVERDNKYAKRVVYAVQQMFGVEFTPGVVLADGNVRNLAWRICNAKQVLAPYSMSTSHGRSTPN